MMNKSALHWSVTDEIHNKVNLRNNDAHKKYNVDEILLKVT